MRHNKWPAIFFLLLILFAGCAGLPAPDQPPEDPAGELSEETPEIALSPPGYPGEDDGTLFFWELNRGGNTLYVLGSIHLANEAIYPLDEVIMAAFERSDLLVEELNFIKPDTLNAQNFVMEHSTLPEGQTLSDYLTEQDLQALRGILVGYGISYKTMEPMQSMGRR